MTSNEFRDYYQTISDIELLEILDNPEDYQALALEAARKELANRNLSEEKIQNAQEALTAKQFDYKNKVQKANAVKDKIKRKGNDLFHTLNPIESDIPRVEKTIRLITIFFSGLFLYQVYSDFRFIILTFKRLPTVDMYGFIELLQVIIILTAVILFWKREPLGWSLFVYIVVSSLFGALWRLLMFINGDYEGLNGLLSKPSLFTVVIQLLVLGGLLYVFFRPNIKTAFKITRQIATVTILISGIIALYFMFGLS